MTKQDASDMVNLRHRTFELHINYGTETLRRILEKHLENMTLKEHLERIEWKVDEDYQKGFVFESQYNLLYPATVDPNIFNFDVCLLTSILLFFGGLRIPNNEESDIRGLRNERNNLCHSTVHGEIKTTFEKSKEYVLRLAKICGSSFYNELFQNIKTLEEKAFMQVGRIYEILTMKHECIAVDLKESCREDDISIKQLKLNLLRWSQQFAMQTNISDLVNALCRRKILSRDNKQMIEEEYNKESQSFRFIEIIIETNEESFLTFLACLREHHSTLADLIENRTTFGTEIEKRLSDLEKTTVTNALSDLFIKKSSSALNSEDIHMAVESKLDRDVNYPKLEECLKEKFGLKSSSTKGCKIKGITWKTEQFAQGYCQQRNKKEATIAVDNRITEMSVADFAKYIEKRFRQFPNDTGSQLKDAVMKECITPKLMARMTPDTMEKTFKTYTHGMFGIGLKDEFSSIQSDLRTEIRSTQASNSSDYQELRKFDCSPDSITYRNGLVMKRYGDLLDPVHEFKTLQEGKRITVAFVVREAIRTIAACMNSLQNGRITFGIRNLNNGTGLIEGLVAKISQLSPAVIDSEIVRGIRHCFGHGQVNSIIKSVRPSCFIPIKDSDAFVIEVDIVPFSGNTIGTPFLVHFPPKGKQEKKFFVYEDEHNIMELDENHQSIQKLYKERTKDRKTIEKKTSNTHLSMKKPSSKETLESKITRGSKNLVDEFIPLVCLGNRKSLNIPQPFLAETLKSAWAVFDFGNTPVLRHDIETDKQIYKKVVIEDTKMPSIPDVRQTPIWVYCNGDTEQKIQRLDKKNWHRDRFKVTVDFVAGIKRRFPKKRSLFFFLFFMEDNPLEKFVYHCIENEFKDDKCILLSNDSSHVEHLETLFLEFMNKDEVSKFMHTGLDWLTISDVLDSVFQGNTLRYYKLPCSSCEFVSMKLNEKDELYQLEVISGDEIEFSTRGMKPLELGEIDIKEQKNFYRGNEVSWWNFYFRNHVCERTCYRQMEREARIMLEEEATDVVQVLSMKYETGSGGTTAAKFILWKLSQFRENVPPSKVYRCCIPKHIDEDTINQIRDFIFFKEKNPMPVVILLDSVSDSDRSYLYSQLNSLAYKTSQKNKLFCLLIVVEAVGNALSDNGTFLKQRLDEEERYFFDQKFKYLEGDPEFDIDSLIAFNLLRQDFDNQGSYLKRLVQRHVSQITDKESAILKIVCLINTFDKKASVPLSIFDDFRNTTTTWSLHSLLGRGAVGIAPFINAQSQDIWNFEHTTEAFKLLVVSSRTSKGIASLRILSQMLAEALLKEIMEQENMDLYTILDSVLNVMELHSNQDDFASEEFVRVICSLFKTRQIQGDNGDIKTKFSSMIMRLKSDCNSGEKDVVIQLMGRCKDITKDEMVGQQLARYYIHTRNFGKAEETIEQCLKTIPNSPYLLDTYGQIFKCRLQTLLSRPDPLKEKKQRIDVVRVAFRAIEKFIEGQRLHKSLRVSREEADQFGLIISYKMEVFTVLLLLDNYKKFLADTFFENFLAYLNGGQVQNSSPFDDIEDECNLKRLKSGSGTQIHLEDSLRFLEEREYQLKVTFGSISHETGEKLLLTFRERFERYYGSTEDTQSYKFHYGVGLKSLMKANAHEKGKVSLNIAYNLIDEHLERLYIRGELNDGNRRDMLIYLGVSIIRLSKENMRNCAESADHLHYQKLLTFSKRLVDIEETASRPHLEAYLYYAMLNWPSENRLRCRIELSTPSEYERRLKQWKKAFDKNFTTDNRSPKVFFAFGKGLIGTDIVDMEDVRIKWRKHKEETENRKRREVFSDRIWNEPFVMDILQRQEGRMDDTGRMITHEVEYKTSQGRLLRYNIKIRSFYPEDALCNRPVSYFLAFSWKDLIAMDVKEKSREQGRERPTQDYSRTEKRNHIWKDNPNRAFNTDKEFKLAPQTYSLAYGNRSNVEMQHGIEHENKYELTEPRMRYVGSDSQMTRSTLYRQISENTSSEETRSPMFRKQGYGKQQPKTGDTGMTRKKKNRKKTSNVINDNPERRANASISAEDTRDTNNTPFRYAPQSFSLTNTIIQRANSSKGDIQQDTPAQSVSLSTSSSDSIDTSANPGKGKVQQELHVKLTPKSEPLTDTTATDATRHKSEIEHGCDQYQPKPFSTDGMTVLKRKNPKKNVNMKSDDRNEPPSEDHSQGRTPEVNHPMTYAARLNTTETVEDSSTLHATKPQQNEESKRDTYEPMLAPRPSRAAKSSKKKAGNRKR